MAEKTNGLIAKRELEMLLALGLTQREIAQELDFNESTISRVRNDPSWAVSEHLTHSLRALRAKLSQRLASQLLSNIAFRPLETCNRRDFPVDDGVASAVSAAVTDAVSGALSGEPSRLHLPRGIQGALLEVGNPDLGLYLIAVDPNLDADEKARVLAHEFKHLTRRVSEGARADFRTRLPESEY